MSKTTSGTDLRLVASDELLSAPISSNNTRAARANLKNARQQQQQQGLEQENASGSAVDDGIAPNDRQYQNQYRYQQEAESTNLRPVASMLTNFTGYFSNRSPPVEETGGKGKWLMTETWMRNRDRIDYFFTTLRFAMSYGTCWRFPYACYNYGGSFFVVYAIMFPVLVLPLYTLDHCLGQYSGLAPVAAFRNIAPAFQGIGFAMTLVTATMLVYYSFLASITFSYLFHSFKSNPPWDTCNRTSAGPDCWDPDLNESCRFVSREAWQVWWAGACHSAADFCSGNKNTCLVGGPWGR